LRGRESPGWVRGIGAPQTALGEAGGEILRLFAATDDLGGLEHEEALLDDTPGTIRHARRVRLG
jgi:hypothetical protein